MRLLPLLRTLLLIALLAFGALLLWGYARNHPEDLPWTRLDLAQPVGAFTGRKLAALGEEPGQCRALLDRAGIRFVALPPLIASGQCGYQDAVRFARGGSDRNRIPARSSKARHWPRSPPKAASLGPVKAPTGRARSSLVQGSSAGWLRA